MDTTGYQVVRHQREVAINDLSKNELREELGKAIDLLEEMSDLSEKFSRLIDKWREGDRYVDRSVS